MTGARRPAVEATSTKCALKGRPEKAGFAIGFVVCWDTPCARSRPVVAEIIDPRESCRKLRRVKFFTIGFADRSLENEIDYLRPALTSKGLLSAPWAPDQGCTGRFAGSPSSI